MALKVSVFADSKVFQAIYDRAKLATQLKVRAGVFGDAASESVGDGFTMLDLVAVHEYGSEDHHIPERSFIRSTMNRPDIVQMQKVMIAKAVASILAGRITTEKALGLIGSYMVEQIKATIRNRATVPNTPNAASTIAAKGSSLPLVDTGRMINAITWDVGK